MVGKDKINPLPDLAAARPPAGMVSAAAESDVANVAFRSNEIARPGGKLALVTHPIMEPS